MGDRLEHGSMMTFNQAKSYIDYFYRLGAEYLTIVGGEPTLHPQLSDIISHARKTGYSKVMLDTNGLLFERIKMIPTESLFYLRISLDGATKETHDKVRGDGNYEKTINAIKQLVSVGYKVRITSTIFQLNKHQAEAFLALAEDLKVELINFHTFSEEGNGAHNKDWSLIPEDWIAFYEKLEELRNKYKVPFRYPPTWVKNDNMKKYLEQGFKGCLGCSVDRLSVFPDGRCYICSLLFDTSLNFGMITQDGFVLNKGQNEYELFTTSALNSTELWTTGCPAEQFLKRESERHTDIISVCRLWRTEN